MAEFLTTKQAAKVLGIRPASVSKAINRGYLSATMFGVQWMLTLEEVERYKRERRVKPKPK